MPHTNVYRCMHFKQNQASSLGGLQRLLTPVVIELSPLRYSAILPHLAHLLEVGVEAESFGEIVSGFVKYQNLLQGSDWQSLFDDIADDVIDGGSGAPIQQLIEQKLATRACHRSIRAGDQLSQIEIHELLQQLDEVDFGVCAHGRPVAVRITPAELERRFHRS